VKLFENFGRGWKAKQGQGGTLPNGWKITASTKKLRREWMTKDAPTNLCSRSYFTEPFLSLLHRPLEGKAHDPGRESQAEGI